MATTSTQYESIPGVDRLTIIRRNNAWMSALELRSNKICLISPLSGLENVAPSAPVSHFLASNHFHNKALASFSERHKRAHVCASKNATPRLVARTGLTFKSLAPLRKQLPDGFDLLEPEGLKTGEVWVRFSVGKKTGWLVTDSFCGKKMTANTTACKQPQMLGTFRSFAVDNLSTYRDWVIAQIKEDRPCLIIPCHGSVIRDVSLPTQLTKLITAL